MTYVSLYRKYRSQQFGDLAGQDHVTNTLQNSLRAGRIAHAYLFCGPRGTGKTSTARLLAKALNCERGPAPEPCDECETCGEIRTGSSLDVKEIDAASHRGIDDIRAIREAVIYPPVRGRYTVYVIDEVHMLTGEAFNALLKTLEEPPPHVVFILATTEVQKIPATILSRCQRFDFRRGTEAQIQDRLRHVAEGEGLAAEEEALALLARHARGSWRDALSLMEQTVAYAGQEISAASVRTVLGLVDDDVLFEMADAVQERRPDRVLNGINDCVLEGKDPRQLLHDLTEHFRELLLMAAGAAGGAGDARASRLRAQATALGLGRLVGAVEALATAEKELRWSQQAQILVEVLLVRLATDAGAAALAGDAPRAEPPAAREAPRRPAPPEPRVETPRPAPSAPRPAPAPPAPNLAGAGGAGAPPPSAPPPMPEPLSVGDSRAGVEADDDSDFDTLFAGTAAASGPAAGEPAPPPVEAPPGDGGAYDPWAEGPTPAAAPAPPAPRPPHERVPAGGAGRVGAASAAPPELGAGGAVEALRRDWRLVREELKRRKKQPIGALLEAAAPASLEDDVLTVDHANEMLATMLGKKLEQDPEALPAAIEAVSGVRYRVRVTSGVKEILRAPKGGTAAPPAPPPAAPPAPRPAQERVPAGGAGHGAAPRPKTSSKSASSPAETASGNGATQAPVEATAPPAPAAKGGAGSRDLVHEVIDLFEGQVMESEE